MNEWDALIELTGTGKTMMRKGGEDKGRGRERKFFPQKF